MTWHREFTCDNCDLTVEFGEYPNYSADKNISGYSDCPVYWIDESKFFPYYQEVRWCLECNSPRWTEYLPSLETITARIDETRAFLSRYAKGDMPDWFGEPLRNFHQTIVDSASSWKSWRGKRNRGRCGTCGSFYVQPIPMPSSSNDSVVLGFDHPGCGGKLTLGPYVDGIRISHRMPSPDKPVNPAKRALTGLAHSEALQARRAKLEDDWPGLADALESAIGKVYVGVAESAKDLEQFRSIEEWLGLGSAEQLFDFACMLARNSRPINDERWTLQKEYPDLHEKIAPFLRDYLQNFWGVGGADETLKSESRPNQDTVQNKATNAAPANAPGQQAATTKPDREEAATTSTQTEQPRRRMCLTMSLQMARTEGSLEAQEEVRFDFENSLIAQHPFLVARIRPWDKKDQIQRKLATVGHGILSTADRKALLEDDQRWRFELTWVRPEYYSDDNDSFIRYVKAAIGEPIYDAQWRLRDGVLDIGTKGSLEQVNATEYLFASSEVCANVELTAQLLCLYSEWWGALFENAGVTKFEINKHRISMDVMEGKKPRDPTMFRPYETVQDMRDEFALREPRLVESAMRTLDAMSGYDRRRMFKYLGGLQTKPAREPKGWRPHLLGLIISECNRRY